MYIEQPELKLKHVYIDQLERKHVHIEQLELKIKHVYVEQLERKHVYIEQLELKHVYIEKLELKLKHMYIELKQSLIFSNLGSLYFTALVVHVTTTKIHQAL